MVLFEILLLRLEFELMFHGYVHDQCVVEFQPNSVHTIPGMKQATSFLARRAFSRTTDNEWRVVVAGGVDVAVLFDLKNMVKFGGYQATSGLQGCSNPHIRTT